MWAPGVLSDFLHWKQAHQTWLISNCSKSPESTGRRDKRQNHCNFGRRDAIKKGEGHVALRKPGPLVSGGLCALCVGSRAPAPQLGPPRGSAGAACPLACSLRACLPNSGEQQGEVRPGEPGQETGVRGVAREGGGEEEEKSSPLTSKSCTMGTSREGGHAATKHRETEITTTGASATAPPNRGAHAPWPPAWPGSSVRRLMPAQDLARVQAEAKPGLSGPGRAARP